MRGLSESSFVVAAAASSLDLPSSVAVWLIIWSFSWPYLGCSVRSINEGLIHSWRFDLVIVRFSSYAALEDLTFFNLIQSGIVTILLFIPTVSGYQFVFISLLIFLISFLLRQLLLLSFSLFSLLYLSFSVNLLQSRFDLDTTISLHTLIDK